MLNIITKKDDTSWNIKTLIKAKKEEIVGISNHMVKKEPYIIFGNLTKQRMFS